MSSSCGASRETFNLSSRFGRRVVWQRLKRGRRVPWNLVFYDSTMWLARLRCRAIGQHTVDASECGYCASCHERRPEWAGPAKNWAA
jgi:hypothetical protein